MKLPPPLSWFYEAWMEFSQALGKVMSWIILTILWIVVFGAYAVIRKCIKVFTAREERKDTMWIDADKDSDLHRQF